MDKNLTRFIGWAAGIIVIIAAVAALIAAYHTYTERYRVSTGPGDDVAVSQVVRSTFAGASDLKVAQLSGTVQSVSTSKSLGMFDASRVMKAPFTVDYFVDLSRMGPSDFLWNPATRTLTVHPPDVRVGAPNVDEAKTTLDRTQGLIVTRGAMADLQHQASGNAERVAGEAALRPGRLAAARRNARADLTRLLGGPLRAAGLGHVTVTVIFPGEGPRSSRQWDVTRSIPEVLADHP
jgi:hypothetical protein